MLLCWVTALLLLQQLLNGVAPVAAVIPPVGVVAVVLPLEAGSLQCCLVDIHCVSVIVTVCCNPMFHC